MAFLTGYLATVGLFGLVIFSPLVSFIEEPSIQNKKYRLVDFFALFISVQGGLAGIKFVWPSLAETIEPQILIFFWVLLSGISWIFGIKILRQRQIESPFKRAVLLGITMPAGILVAAIAFPIMTGNGSSFPFIVRTSILLVVSLTLRYLGKWIVTDSKTNRTFHHAG